ncbi:hypothetical protein JXA32_00910, partial [Candidatus Sumerlaeota bacterium]|nr:hypothetical protein [Candidatus Sumerlaeota bacterium]
TLKNCDSGGKKNHLKKSIFCLDRGDKLTIIQTPKPQQDEFSTLPPYDIVLAGPNEVRVRNPNSFEVLAGLRSGVSGKNFKIGANDTTSVFVPDGYYDIYFVYSYDNKSLYQGDSFNLNDNGIEIQIVEVVDGNYSIRKVK